jgi:uncharacterized protein YjbJ (UPF0337 family)
MRDSGIRPRASEMRAHDAATHHGVKLSLPIPANRRTPMDNNRKDGASHEIKGAVKEGVGKVTGDRSQEVSGNIEKNAGKVQREVGKAADDVRDAAD